MIHPRTFERILVLEDDRPLRAAIVRYARRWGAQILEAGTVREGTALLSPPPDLIIADVRLPDGSASAVFREASRAWPRPTIIAMSGAASASETFEMGQMGVRTYLPKPFSLRGLADAVAEAMNRPPHIDPFIAESVGRAGLRQTSDRVRTVMLRQALALAGGSRTGAARLLDVSRQAVQQGLRTGPRRPAPSNAGSPTPGGRAPGS